MQEFEKIGAFYLGRQFDIGRRELREGLVLYDSRDLVTHGVIIGMTGSGKTGLGIGLLEEAAIDGVPALAIDPKGDLGNLLLTFPRLAPEDFRPWINEDDAARKALTPDAFAAAEAESWRKGLESWGQDGARIERLRAAAEFAIYTPGSSAGLGISILRSFAAPPPHICDDAELFADRVSTSVGGLLTLVDVDADPVRSREHILLSTILSTAWKAGEQLDLAAIIARIQAPPVVKVGVLDVESFFPAKERFELAMRLNALLAAPGFAAWMEGEPLDIDRLLYTPAGKPRIAILSIAHLEDRERMFFVSLLLNEVLGWARKQSGTTSLRALLYMDEVAGYMPPVARPPSKLALLTLLKQARAFGVGVVLATQNPVDLDYRGLGNTGTWFLGRLQTEQDKARVLDGLEGALSGRSGFDRPRIDDTLSGLGKRVFLLHNVHEDAPEVFQTRWTMSYLRGPLTRDQVRAVMAPVKVSVEQASPSPAAGASGPTPAVAPSLPAPEATEGASGAGVERPPRAAESRDATPAPGVHAPVLPPDVTQYFVPARGGASRYAPRLWCDAHVEFSDRGMDLRETRDVAVLVPFSEGPAGVTWDDAEPVDLTFADLQSAPAGPAGFEELRGAAMRARSYVGWQKDFARWLYDTQRLEVLHHPETRLASRPGESEREFRIRLQLAMREARDAQTDNLRQKYAPKRAAIDERLRRAQAMVEKEQEQASDQKMQSMVTMGASVLGALLGRKVISSTNLGKAASAARSVGRSRKESQDVRRAEETVQALQKQLAELVNEVEGEIAALAATSEAMTAPLETVVIKPKKTQITVGHVALAWVPR